MYIALIADVIDSKLFKERSDLQKKLEAVLFHMNNRFETYLASRLTLTLGDEFQALFTLDAPIFQIIDSLRQDLKPAQLRFGIGLGKIVTDIDPLQSIGADGPAYWNARAAINLVHQKNDYGNTQLYFSSGKKEEDFQINALLAAGEAIKLRGLLKLSIYSEDFSQQELAQALSLNPSALSKRLKSSSIRVYLRSRAAALAAIQAIDVTEGGQNERIF